MVIAKNTAVGAGVERLGKHGGRKGEGWNLDFRCFVGHPSSRDRTKKKYKLQG